MDEIPEMFGHHLIAFDCLAQSTIFEWLTCQQSSAGIGHTSGAVGSGGGGGGGGAGGGNCCCWC